MGDIFSPRHKKTLSINYLGFNHGGERGIRTLDTLLTYTPLAGERLQPLGHLSRFFYLLPSNYYRDFPRLPDLADFAQL